MDPNEDETQMRAEELSKMRSNSSSPSNLSVASSGSPLVRNQSITSGQTHKRPAATSIAAAQLQCQLEFVNKMQANQSGRSSDLAKNKKQSQQQQQQQQHRQKPKFQQSKMQMVMGNSQVVVNAETNAGSCDDERMKKRTKTNAEKIKEKQSGGESDKSFGYVLAKSIAFRAHR